MRQIALALLLTSLIGCSDAPARPEPVSVTAELAQAPVSFPAPVSVPAKPQAEAVGEMVCYADPAAHLAHMAALTTNSDIAGEAATTIAALDRQSYALLEVARGLERRANFYANQNHDARAELRDERREHAVDNWIHRAIFLIGVAVGL